VNTKYILILLVTILSLSFAKETEVQKSVAVKFKMVFNQGQAQELFSMFDQNMKSAIDLDKTKELISSLNEQFGSIESMSYYKQNNSYGLYKSKFSKGEVLLVQISLDQSGSINGLFFKPFKEVEVPIIERNITKMILPFKGIWSVVWGGDNVKDNYHVESEEQKNAFDFVIEQDYNTFTGDGKSNEQYFAFGKEIIAPCKSQVYMVVDGIPDNPVGEKNPTFATGNTVILETSNKEYIILAHFKKNSIVVKEGQSVNQGDLLGLCGNSGNSTEPHLHFHLQNTPKLYNGVGIKCYFDNIIVNDETKKDYSPIKDDKVGNK
jgi:hypothetical protein